MKLQKLVFGILLVLTATSCVSTLPLNQQFYNTKKVGVIIDIDSISIAKSGAQGLLDMAFTPGNRFKEPLQKIEPKLKLDETLKAEITNILNSKNKQFEFVNHNEALIKFEKPKSAKKYSKLDYRNLKTVHNVDEILYLKVKYGLLVSYYGVIEIGKHGYVYVGTEIIDLNDNSLLQQENVQSVAAIKGNWKDGVDHDNLKNSIQEAINKSISTLKAYYR